ncbi:acylphosphatase [bacterium]|nr:acylphosphatase [bacterium]|tara:strand:- start:1793 stop:2068 length:276 start_codon:yes stop_codon:yes gene_type:complete
MKTLYTIKIFGKVQGVFFRMETKEKADELGITGLVRNEPDNSLFIEAQGEEKDLKIFIDWCRKGPKHAKVESLDMEKGIMKEYQSFEITHL